MRDACRRGHELIRIRPVPTVRVGTGAGLSECRSGCLLLIANRYHEPQSTYRCEGGKDRPSQQSLAQPGNCWAPATQDRSTRHEDGDVQRKVGTQSNPVSERKRNSKRR